MTAEDAATLLRAALALPGIASSDFDLNPAVAPPTGHVVRPAAVLVAVMDGPSGPQIVLTKRSSALKHHPGQIAFPGGRTDADDLDARMTALREAEEEVGLPRDHVRVLGALPAHETVTGFSVTPVLGLIHRPFDARPEPGEVAEVFGVPFAHLMDPARYGVQARRWRGQLRKYYVVPYGPYYVWGATARILRGLAERVDHCRS